MHRAFLRTRVAAQAADPRRVGRAGGGPPCRGRPTMHTQCTYKYQLDKTVTSLVVLSTPSTMVFDFSLGRVWRRLSPSEHAELTFEAVRMYLGC